MSRTDYYHVEDGEWIVVTKRKHKSQCCDCGLVHVLNFRVNEHGQIEVQSARDARATAAVRRAFKFEKD
ncbi:hypothetical protein [Bradyrhizobium sp. Leo121]|uniref:hypothetical protein n=1 Tax=Bradyrhizobium sp. Leo121 TaxID=1571195 RepID=UPI00102A9C25|nr:hypothetical protein [Bradyrhizobium sp. Leo121]RZN21946.1 hypothetical protein CWO90_32545 [Bradyrhizobium sp. Leo121]